MANHEGLTGNKLHTPFCWIFENEAERTGESVTADDLSKLAWQQDDGSLWTLVSTEPGWEQVGGSLSVLTTRGDILTVGQDSKPKRLPRGSEGQILSWDITGNTVTVDLPQAGSDIYFGKSQIFITNGTFTVPAGVTELVVELVGGGGGGGSGSTGTYKTGTGGGGGRFARVKLTGFSGGEIIPVTIGASGIGGRTYPPVITATAGGTTSFGVYVTCTGGRPGLSASTVPLLGVLSGDLTLASESGILTELLASFGGRSSGSDATLDQGRGGDTPWGSGGLYNNTGTGYGSGGGSSLGTAQGKNGAIGRLKVYWE